MRISDWSSDVCSSDLAREHEGAQIERPAVDRREPSGVRRDGFLHRRDEHVLGQFGHRHAARARVETRGIGLDTEQRHRTVVEAVGLQPLEDFRSEEHTSELQSLMRISYAVFCLKKKTIEPAYAV